MHHIENADCLDFLGRMAPDCIDSFVQDPPYGLAFMGKDWDHAVPGPEFFAAQLRVAKPGAHLVAFGGTRTYHRLACAIEDAGWELRDNLCWLYGSGFPKSHSVSKAIDKGATIAPLFGLIRDHLCKWRDAAGMNNKALNEAVGSATSGAGMARHWTSSTGGQHAIPSRDQWYKLKALLTWPDCELDALYETLHDGAARPVLGKHLGDMGGLGGERLGNEGGDITAPATDEAKKWEGFGTALKPAWEPIILARKPFRGTVANNVLKYGTGALNIDGCRIGSETVTINTFDDGAKPFGGGAGHAYTGRQSQGRWPANVALDPEAGAMLGEPARFFYQAKASKKEREEGLEDFTPKQVNDGRETSIDNAYQRGDTKRRNTHPTVKPIELMRWLVRMVTPPGGIVCDPFCGSGSTGCAAVSEGFDFVGIEREAEFAALAEARITHWSTK